MNPEPESRLAPAHNGRSGSPCPADCCPYKSAGCGRRSDRSAKTADRGSGCGRRTCRAPAPPAEPKSRRAPSIKNRDSRSGDIPSSKVAGYRPARAVPIATSSMSLAKICTFGPVDSLVHVLAQQDGQGIRLLARSHSPAPRPAPRRRVLAGEQPRDDFLFQHRERRRSRKKLVTLISRSRNSSTACSRSALQQLDVVVIAGQSQRPASAAAPAA